MRTWIKALLAGSLALGPAAGFAAIDNTHHDTIFLGASASERCAYCHSKVNLTATAVPLGKVGAFCVQVCHLSGTGIDSTRPQVLPTSPGNYVYQGGAYIMTNNGGGPGNTDTNILIAHGFTPSVLPGLNAAGSASEQTAVAATGWPYTTAGADMQCTSCHAVHDASNPPFLNAKLAGTGATPQVDNFCARCHNLDTRVQDFTAAGDHPTEFEWDPALATTRSANKGDGTFMNQRQIVVGSGITNLNVPAAGVDDTAADTAGALNSAAAGVYWNMGGHLIQPTTGLPKSGASTNENVGCYSCHMVHQTNTVASPYGQALLVGQNLADVCYGCHTPEPGNSGYGHPIGPDADVPLNHGYGWPALTMSAGYIAINGTYYKDTVTVPTKGENAPMCVTCHDVHEAATGRMAIRVIGGKASYVAGENVCEQCHNTTGSFGNPVVANAHHPGSTNIDYVAGDGFPASISWATVDGLGDLADGLTCGDCHVGDGTATKRATAHNWN